MDNNETCVENRLHEVFKLYCDKPHELSNEIGELYSTYGHDQVNYAMIKCLKVAYLRLQFHNNIFD